MPELKQEKHQRGFTLVELMVVVAIIGILAAVGIPQFNKFVVNATTTEATTNLGKLAEQIEAYQSLKGNSTAATHLDTLVENTTGTGTASSAISSVLPTWSPTSNTKFTYTISINAAGNYCLKATGTDTDRTGFIMMSKTAASDTAGWDENFNKVDYITRADGGTAGTPVAGGNCTAAAAVQ